MKKYKIVKDVKFLDKERKSQQEQINDLQEDYWKLYNRTKNNKSIIKFILFLLFCLLLFLIWNKDAFIK